jgi:acetyl-CoA carboxylase biotin carboxyl carrier protein
LSEKKKRGKPPGAPPREGGPEGETPGPTTGGPMNVRLLEQIVKLMAANDLNMVDVRDGDQRVILKRGPAGPTISYGHPGYASPAPAPPPSQPQAGAGASSGPSSGAGGSSSAPDENAGLLPIKAEMVGTFYASPTPGEKSFVNVGSEVDEDTEVCLIEAMKNYFAVKAGVSGTIARVLVQDGQTVQFDQPMFLVRPR